MVAKNAVVDEQFISTDAGNGWAACYRLVSGKIRQHGIPHVRARVTGAKISTDLGASALASYADFKGERYGYGDGVWLLTQYPLDTHQNSARRYGGAMHIFMILVNLAEMGVKSGSDLTLIVPAPPGLLNEVAPQIKAALLAGESGRGDGRWSIHLRRDKKPREYTVRRVIVLPEGAGAYAAFRYQLTGDPVLLPDARGDDLLAGQVAVVDLGAGTGDTYMIVDGSLAPETMRHATDDRAGILHNVLKPLLGVVMDAVPAATHLTPAHLDSVLRAYAGATTDAARVAAATLRVSGHNVNIEQAMLQACERYAEWVAENKLDPLWASGADAVLAAGGGWVYIESWIRGWYPGRNLLFPGMFKHTKGIPLYDLNGVGQLALAAAVMKAQQV